MSNFTPEQIQEILDIFFDNFAHRQYIGARYVPIFGRKDEDSIIWDNTGPYEPLTIVLYQGNSYTSRQFVPEGVDIDNEDYWAETGNYNAQVEQYRLEVMTFNDRIEALEKSNLLVYPENYGAIGNGIADDTIAIQNAIIAAEQSDSCGCVVFQNKSYLITDTLEITNAILIVGAEIQEYTPSIKADFDGTIFSVSHGGVCFSNICLTCTDDHQFACTGIKTEVQTDVDTWIRQCKFFYMHTCVELYGRSAVFEQNNFSNSHICVKLGNTSTTDTARSYIFHDNRFHSWGRTDEDTSDGVGIFLDFEYSYNRNEIFFTDNYIDLSTSTNPFFYGDFFTGYVTNNCYIYNISPFFDLTRNLFSNSNESCLYVCDNYIKSRTTTPLQTAFNFKDCGNFYVSGNKTHNVRSSIVKLDGGTNIYINDNEAHNTSAHPLLYMVDVTSSDYVYIHDNSNNSVIDYIVKGSTPGSHIYVYNNDLMKFKKIADFNVYPRNIDKWKDYATINIDNQVGSNTIAINVTAPNVIYLEVAGTVVPFTRSVTNRYVSNLVVRNDLTDVIYGYCTLVSGVLTYGNIKEYNLSTSSVVSDNVPITRIVDIA